MKLKAQNLIKIIFTVNKIPVENKWDHSATIQVGACATGTFKASVSSYGGCKVFACSSPIFRLAKAKCGTAHVYYVV